MRITDLTPEQRSDIEAMCEQDALPSEIAHKLAIPVYVAASARRSWLARTRETGASAAVQTLSPQATATKQVMDPADVALQTLQSQTYSDMRRGQLEDELSYQRQKRRLELRQIRLDQRQQEIDMRRQTVEIDRELDPVLDDEYEPDEDDEYEEMQDNDKQYGFDQDPVGATMSFFKDLKGMNDAGTRTPPDAIQSPQTNAVLDPTKELSWSQIDREIARTPRTELVRIKAAIGTDLEPELVKGLKAKYPGITDDNVQRVLARLRLHE